VDTIKGQSFESALSGLPHAEWKFIAKPEWCEHSGNRGFSSDMWIVFGTEPNGGSVVVALKNRKANLIFDPDKGGNVVIESDWMAQHGVVSAAKDIVKSAPAAVKAVSFGWKDGAKPRKAPQKYVEWPGGELAENKVTAVKMGSGGASLKDILVSSGMIGGDHAALKGRKTNVEVIPHYSIEKMRRLRAERSHGGPHSGQVYAYECFDFEVRVDGKSATISDEAFDNLKANLFIIGVFSYDPHDNVPKNLTKMRPSPRGMTLGPEDSIRLLAEALTSKDPSWLHEALKKAAAEYAAPATKEAARAAVRAAMQTAV
jgi:hypothetical protein